MASFTTFAAFNQSSETWDLYVARFEWFLLANDFGELSNSCKKAYFLSFCGNDVFEMARALVVPKSITAIPCDVLLAKLKNHYAPMPSHIVHRHMFHRRNQAEGKSINQFVAALRAAALYREFRDLNDVLLDRFICGVWDLCLQPHLLAKHDLILQAALDEAHTVEMSEQSTAVIQKMSSPPSARKPLTAHHEEADSGHMMDKDEDIHHLKSMNRKSRPGEKKFPNAICIGCGANHPVQPVNLEMPSVCVVGERVI